MSKYQPTTGKFKTILYGSIWVKCGTRLGNGFILSALSLNGDFISKLTFIFILYFKHTDRLDWPNAVQPLPAEKSIL